MSTAAAQVERAPSAVRMIAAAFAIGLVLVIVNGVFQPFVVLPPGAVRIPTSGFGPAELCTLQARPIRSTAG